MWTNKNLNCIHCRSWVIALGMLFFCPDSNFNTTEAEHINMKLHNISLWSAVNGEKCSAQKLYNLDIFIHVFPFTDTSVKIEATIQYTSCEGSEHIPLISKSVYVCLTYLAEIKSLSNTAHLNITQGVFDAIFIEHKKLWFGSCIVFITFLIWLSLVNFLTFSSSAWFPFTFDVTRSIALLSSSFINTTNTDVSFSDIPNFLKASDIWKNK